MTAVLGNCRERPFSVRHLAPDAETVGDEVIDEQAFQSREEARARNAMNMMTSLESPVQVAAYAGEREDYGDSG